MATKKVFEKYPSVSERIPSLQGSGKETLSISETAGISSGFARRIVIMSPIATYYGCHWNNILSEEMNKESRESSW